MLNCMNHINQFVQLPQNLIDILVIPLEDDGDSGKTCIMGVRDNQ